MNNQYPLWQRVIGVPGILISGTAVVIFQKILFDQQGFGLESYGYHSFSKPWFQTYLMLFCMIFALFLHKLFKTENNNEDPFADKEKRKKVFRLTGYIGVLYLSATTLMNIGLQKIQASVWQMLRGSLVLFSSIFSAFILKRPHYSFMWWSVMIIFIGLSVVGIAAIISTGVGKEGVSKSTVIIAILITAGAQILQVIQIILEDYLMHDIGLSCVQLVGLEGVWGFLFSVFIFIPMNMFNATPQNEGDGIHENIIDTLLMISKSSSLKILILFYSILTFLTNVTGTLATEITSAVVRTIVEGFRTMGIWMVQLTLHYTLRNTDYGKKHPSIGEEWSVFSWMQLSGFLLLFTGMLLYNKILRMPFFDYPGEQRLSNDPLLSTNE